MEKNIFEGNFRMTIPVDKDFNLTGPTEVEEIDPIKPTDKFITLFHDFTKLDKQDGSEINQADVDSCAREFPPKES